MDKGYLILKRASASRPSGEWNEDDYDVLADAKGKCESFRGRLPPFGWLALHLMSRAQLRELTALFVIGSTLTVAVFFLALWLLPDQPFTAFPFPRFP